MKCALVNRQVMMRLHSHYRCDQSLRVLSSLLTPPTTTTTTCTNNAIQQQQQQQQQYRRTYVSHFKFTEPTKQNHKNFERVTAFGSFHRCCMSFYAPSTCAGEKIVVKVPTMGDSITEGTIVEWTAAIGQAVQTDDVIALIETDKVTIDIKADMNGVITQHFGSVDETVEVGAKLYELDTDAVASVTAPAAASPTTATSSPSEPAPTQTNVTSPEAAATTASAHRSPSIKFLGKEGWDALRKGHDTNNQAVNGASAPSPKKYGVTTMFDDKSVKDPMYGRPKFTEAEMEALLTGGATLAPQVLSLSTGAKFKL